MKGMIDLNKKTILCLVCLLLFVLSSCAKSNPTNNPALIPTGAPKIAPTSNLTVDPNHTDINIPNYSVYQQGATNDEQDEFSLAMSKNPIDAKMDKDCETQITTTTSEFQDFYNGYLKMWQDELLFSIQNLKKYLSDDESLKLDTAQEAWRVSLQSNDGLDKLIIDSHKIGLGTQYVYSALGYLIDQYRERDFHIKYMTYLIEIVKNADNDNNIPATNQMWDKFKTS